MRSSKARHAVTVVIGR